ncbi:MAG: hypothetical protein VX776_11100 [Planctomycetota bacterium]|nr:hypothetical protein [Planctomycetota bacterium]
MPKQPLLRRLTLMPLYGMFLLFCGALFAEEAKPKTPNATKSQVTRVSAREQAKASIPWDKLTPAAQEKLQGVVTDSSVFHRSPFQKTPCDHNVYLHLIRHPELVVNIWELMGVSKLKMDREEDYLINIDDGYGTQSQLELIYGNKNLHIFYAEGAYQGNIIPTTSKGQVVLILETKESVEDRKPVVSHRLHMFIQFDKSTNQLIVRTLQSLFLKMVDMNFAETTKFIGQIDEIIQDNPEGMKRLSGRLTRVQTPIRKQFNKVIEHANAQYVRIASNSK